MKPLAVPPLTIQIYPYLGTELPPFTFKFNALLSVITTPCDHLSILVKFHFSSPSTTSHLQILTRTLTPLLVTSFERNLLSPENLSPPQSLSPHLLPQFNIARAGASANSRVNVAAIGVGGRGASPANAAAAGALAARAQGCAQSQ